jgi:hypothetical protein
VQKPGKVIFVITTDREENAYNFETSHDRVDIMYEMVNEMVSEKRFGKKNR